MVIDIGRMEFDVEFDCGTIKWYTAQELEPVDAVTLLGEVTE